MRASALLFLVATAVGSHAAPTRAIPDHALQAAKDAPGIFSNPMEALAEASEIAHGQVVQKREPIEGKDLFPEADSRGQSVAPPDLVGSDEPFSGSEDATEANGRTLVEPAPDDTIDFGMREVRQGLTFDL